MRTTRSAGIIKAIREILLAFFLMLSFMTCMLYAADIGITRMEKAGEHTN